MDEEADSPWLIPLENLSTAIPTRPPFYHIHKIALLLPVGAPGIVGEAAKAVLKGVKLSLRQYEKGRRRHIIDGVVLYDTYQADSATSPPEVVKAYHTAIQNGANLIIGPMLRENLAQLQEDYGRFDIPVITMVYNPLTPPKPKKGLYQFSGLSLNAEVVATAERMRREHGPHALLLVDRNDQRAMDAEQYFIRHFHSLENGEPLPTLHLSRNDHDLSKIADALGITAQDVSHYKALQTKIRRLRRDEEALTEKEMDTTTLSSEHKSILQAISNAENALNAIVRRNAVDSIVILGDESFSSVVRPIISYYLGHDIPTYVTSRAFDETKSVEPASLQQVFYPGSAWLKAATTRPYGYPVGDYAVLQPLANPTYRSALALGVDLLDVAPLVEAVWQSKSAQERYSAGILGEYFIRQDGRIVREPYYYNLMRNRVKPEPPLRERYRSLLIRDSQTAVGTSSP